MGSWGSAVITAFVAVVLCAVTGWGFVAFLLVESHRTQLPVDVYPKIFDLSLCLPIAAGFIFVHLLARTILEPVARWAVVRKTKWSSNVYEAKVERFCSAVFKLSFFIFISTFGYFRVLQNAEWTPAGLWGSGITRACFGKGNAGDTQAVPALELLWYYKVAFGYHLNELFFQIAFERGKPDLREMVVHHMTTCVLIFTSFYLNFVRIGSLVLFIHDLSDVPIYLTKTFVDTPLKYLTFTFYLGILVSWAHLRLYCFPRYIIRSVAYESELEVAQYGTAGRFGHRCFVVGLSLLLCLHVVWYFKLLKMGLSFVITGETKDTQANLEKIETMDLPDVKREKVM